MIFKRQFNDIYIKRLSLLLFTSQYISEGSRNLGATTLGKHTDFTFFAIGRKIERLNNKSRLS